MKKKFYHRTGIPAADAILREGFEDFTTYISDFKLQGVWLSDRPLDVCEGAKSSDALFAVILNVPKAELDCWEILEEGKTYREWCIPAKVVNRGSFKLVSEG